MMFYGGFNNQFDICIVWVELEMIEFNVIEMVN